MAFAVIIIMLCAPANYLVGYLYAKRNKMSPHGIGTLAAIIPAFGMVCAITEIMRNVERDNEYE